MAWRAMQSTVGVSTTLAALTDVEERVWWRLLAHSDPWGRLDARPLKLRALCWPLLTITDEQAGRALLTLQELERIVVWKHSGQTIIQIVDFEKHQPREAFRKRPTASAFPDPPANLTPSEGLIESLYRLVPDTFRKDSGIQERNPEIAGVSGSLPEGFRKPSGPDETRREGEETRQQQQHAGARDPDAAAEDLERLRTAGWTPRQIAAARQDLPRAIAWLNHAENDPTVQSPAALAWTKFESGAAPTSQPPPQQSTRAPGALAGERSARPPKLSHRCTHTYPDGTTCDSTFATPERLADHTADCHTQHERVPLPPEIAALANGTLRPLDPPRPPAPQPPTAKADA